MTFEFNSDGSLKFPDWLLRISSENKSKMRNQRCILIKRDLISTVSPKKCVLHIRLSDKILDSRFVETIYNSFRDRSQVPSKLIKSSDKEFDIEIGTCFRRCSDCNSVISHFRDFFDGNVIENKGNCSYEGINMNFCYEDHFD